MPSGWEYDDSGWHGLDALENQIDVYSDNSPVYVHIVKTFFPMKRKDLKEAKEMAALIRQISGDNIELIDEIDSVEVGGYPAAILYFANYVDNDTVIQKQFVSYLQDSHIVVYLNEVFHPINWELAEQIGDRIIETVKFKKVNNPLDDEKVAKKIIQSAMDNGEFTEEMAEQGQQMINRLENE